MDEVEIWQIIHVALIKTLKTLNILLRQCWLTQEPPEVGGLTSPAAPSLEQVSQLVLQVFRVLHT